MARSPGTVVISLSGCVDGGFLAEQWVGDGGGVSQLGWPRCQRVWGLAGGVRSVEAEREAPFYFWAQEGGPAEGPAPLPAHPTSGLGRLESQGPETDGILPRVTQRLR